MSCLHRSELWLPLILAFVVSVLPAADPPAPRLSIPLKRNLELPLIPVTTQAGDALLLLDTGSTRLALDPLLARTLADRPADVPDAGEFPLKVDLQVAGFSSQHLSVGIFDFTPVREHTASPILGVLGMSALRETCLRCDFDRERLSVYEKLPPTDALSIQMFLSEGGRPTVIAALPSRSFPLMIDLGKQGGISLPAEVFDSLDLPVIRSMERRFTGGGVNQTDGYKVVTLKLGAFVIKDVHVERNSDEFGLAGLEFLCRFNLDLDFPQKRLYLSKSQRFLARGNPTRFGLRLFPYQGTELKEGNSDASVRKGSEAQSAGIRPGDVIVSVKTDYYGESKGSAAYDALSLPRLGPSSL